MFAHKAKAVARRRRRPLLPASIPALAFAITLVGIISSPCFGMNHVRSGLRSSNISTKKLVRDNLSQTTGNVTITYDISNDCGLDADDIMNEVNNTLKEGLIAATTAIVGNILEHESLASYSDEHPVVIDRVIDIITGCSPGRLCQLVVSTISVVLEQGNGEGDAADEVKEAIVDGMKESFEDGSFFGAIPSDTVICPEMASVDDMARLALVRGESSQGRKTEGSAGRGGVPTVFVRM